MPVAQIVLWVAAGLTLLESLYLLVRMPRRVEAAAAGLMFLLTAAALAGLAFSLRSSALTGPVLLSISAPLIPVAWLWLSVRWGRDVGDQLLKRSKPWLLLTVATAILLAAASAVRPAVQYVADDPGGAYFQMTGFSFPLLIFALTVSLFAFGNIENCYRSAMGTQRSVLRAGMLLTFVATGLAFAAITLGILSHRLMLWSAAGLAVLCPVLNLLLILHLQRLTVVSDGVVVTRSVASSSRVVLTGGVYCLAVGLMSRLILTYGYAPDVLVTLLATVMAAGLLLTVVVGNSGAMRPAGHSGGAGGLSMRADQQEFIGEIMSCKTSEEILQQVKVQLGTAYGVTGGALVEKNDSGPFRAQFLDRPGGRLETTGMDEMGDWLLRYGRPIRYADLVERTLECGFDVKQVAAELNLKPLLWSPIISRQTLVGILILQTNTNEAEPLAGFLETVASPLAMAVQNCRFTQQLVRSREMESFHKIASYVLHDLKNSVGMLDMLLSNARSNIDNPDFQQSMIRTIGDAVGRQRRIISRLSEPKAGETLSRTEIDLNQLLDRVIDKVQVNKVERIEFVDSRTEVPTITANSQQLMSVFENLIVNAMEAMPVGGQLKLESECVDKTSGGKEIVIRVTDAGVGMSREFIDNKLFKPFTSTKKKGLGIGMYQTYEAIKQMEGDIAVVSEEGQGTTFSVTLPV